MSDGIIDASEVVFPERVCIDQYRSSTNSNRTFAAPKQIKELNVSCRETNLAENAEIIR